MESTDLVLDIVMKNIKYDINDIDSCKDIIRHTLINKYFYNDSNNTSYWYYNNLKLGFTNIKISDDLKEAKKKFKLNILIYDFEKEVIDLQKKFEYFLVAIHLIDESRLNEYKKPNKEFLLDVFKNYFENGFSYSFVDNNFTLFNQLNLNKFQKDHYVIAKNTIRYFHLKGCVEEDINNNFDFRDSITRILVLSRCIVYFKNIPLLKYSYNGYLSDYFELSKKIKFRQLELDVNQNLEISVYNNILYQKLNINDNGETILENSEYIKNFKIIPSKFYVI